MTGEVLFNEFIALYYRRLYPLFLTPSAWNSSGSSP